MPLNDLQATVTIGGQSLSGYLVRTERGGNLARISHQFAVECDQSLPYNFVPNDTVVITEEGTTVLTGYVDKVARLRDPEARIVITGRDSFKRAEDYFVDEPTLVANGEQAQYWVGYFCNLVGLSYVITSGNSTQAVTPDIPLGMQTVAEILAVLASFMLCSMRMRPDGVLEFVQLTSGAFDHDFVDVLDGEYTRGDDDIRNVAKIWGLTPEGEQLLYQERREVNELVVDRIMVVANPFIQTAAQAAETAGVLLDHFAIVDEISSFQHVGDPTVRLGQVGQVEIESGNAHVNPITDLTSAVGPDGYEQSITLGRKNLFLPVYAVGDNFAPCDSCQADWTLTNSGSSASDRYNDCAAGAAGLYLVGRVNGGTEKLERRSLANGSLITAVNTPENFTRIALSSSAIYCVNISDQLYAYNPFTLAELWGGGMGMGSVGARGVCYRSTDRRIYVAASGPQTPFPSEDQGRLIVGQFDTNGNRIQSDSIAGGGTIPYDICADGNGIYVCGTQRRVLTSGSSPYQWYMARISPVNLSVVWELTYSYSPSVTEEAMAMAVSAGFLYIAGEDRTVSNDHKLALQKRSTLTGALQWAISYEWEVGENHKVGGVAVHRDKVWVASIINHTPAEMRITAFSTVDGSMVCEFNPGYTTDLWIGSSPDSRDAQRGLDVYQGWLYHAHDSWDGIALERYPRAERYCGA